MKELAKVKGNNKFTDPAMPHDGDMVWWNGMDGPKNFKKVGGKNNFWSLQYHRISDKIPGSKFKGARI